MRARNNGVQWFPGVVYQVNLVVITNQPQRGSPSLRLFPGGSRPGSRLLGLPQERSFLILCFDIWLISRCEPNTDCTCNREIQLNTHDPAFQPDPDAKGPHDAGKLLFCHYQCPCYLCALRFPAQQKIPPGLSRAWFFLSLSRVSDQ